MSSCSDCTTYCKHIKVLSKRYVGKKETSIGLRGPQGFTGLTGPQGQNGIAGSTGPMGLSGSNGATGPMGLQGNTGPTGFQGLSGSQGAIGATGPTGIQGLIGLQGAIGVTGPTGFQGLSGSQGAIGATGPTGLQGLIGSQGSIGATGPTGFQGSAGAVGATGPGQAVNLAYTNAVGPIALFPPLSTEVTVVSVTDSLQSGQDIKLDYAFELDFIVTASWQYSYEARLYRDATLINTRTIERAGSTAGTHTFQINGTYVDTAPSTSSITYGVRIIITSATNVTSVASGSSLNLNMIIFG